jgi:DNA-binding transcriptional LysR family regulator
MNLRSLKTLITVSNHPSFTSAADEIGLTHSAVSQQIKGLEEELQMQIFDRITRPPRLTDAGYALVALARQILDIADEMRMIAKEDTLAGSVIIGVVPSALMGLIPPALARLQRAHPRLTVHIRSGLSGDLAQAVRAHEIDLAVVTEPRVLPDGLRADEICREPLDVIMPPDVAAQTDAEALTHPFIWFNRRTWAGQQIQEHLAARRLFVRPVTEIDSIEAIESLVAHGLGVSITPRRFGLKHSASGVRRLPFGQPQLTRGLVLIAPESGARRRLAKTLLALLKEITDQA